MTWHKLNAKKTNRDGYWFDSELEASMYDLLKWYVGAGLYSDLKVKPPDKTTQLPRVRN